MRIQENNKTRGLLLHRVLRSVDLIPIMIVITIIIVECLRQYNTMEGFKAKGGSSTSANTKHKKKTTTNNRHYLENQYQD